MTSGALQRLLIVALALLVSSCRAGVIHEVRSSYSHIQVVDYGSRRALLFIGSAPHDAVETLMDLREPYRLQLPYARAMMAGLLYRPEATSCLLVGLGGGGLVRFLNHYFPALHLDVVEIDPAVVAVAREYFGTGAGPRTRILTEDGNDFLQRTPDRYDIILIDAHLHPGEATDSAGLPLHLKTLAFLHGLRERLRPGGVVLFNMIEGPGTRAFIDSMRGAFAAVHVFRPGGSGNVVVAGAPTGFELNERELRARARALDQRGDFGFSFERVLAERDR